MKNKKKILLVFLAIIIALILIVLGIKSLIDYLRIKYAKIEVSLVQDLTLNFTEKKHVSDFINSINGNLINDYIIDSTKIGDKSVSFEFINDDGIKAHYTYTVSVVDKVPPVIWLGDSYSITVGNNVDLTSKILCGDNEDSNPNKYIEGEYDYNTVGAYPLVFKATDRSGNETKKEFVLYVNEKRDAVSNTNLTKTYTYFSDVIKTHKTENTKIGIDVSVWQGDIDFEAIKNAGVEFIIIRVGGTYGTDGEYFVDSKFLNNIKKANEYNIDVGIYFYSYANSNEHAKRDALWVIEQIKDYNVSLPIAFDWENWNTFNDYHLSLFELTDMANAFLKTLEEAGYKGMLYSSKSYLERLWMPISYDIWLAHYTKKTNYEGDYSLWQLCNNGRVEGIEGEVDIDVMYLK